MSKFRLVLLAFIFAALGSWSDDCLNSGKPLPVDDAHVLKLKATTANQYLERAHVSGTVLKVYKPENGHNHFEIQIGPNTPDTLEVVFSEDFGQLPTLKAGDKIEACGDYITSNADTSEYKASPDGAIIHWVHASDTAKHDSGFVMVNGTTYGDKTKPHGHSSVSVLASSVKPLKVPSCFKTDDKGVILNPNYGKSGVPYGHVYGFLFDGSSVYNVYQPLTSPLSSSSDKLVQAGKKSLQSFFSTDLHASMTGDCAPAPANGATAPAATDVPANR